jgi:hypothetical protein
MSESTFTLEDLRASLDADYISPAINPVFLAPQNVEKVV